MLLFSVISFIPYEPGPAQAFFLLKGSLLCHCCLFGGQTLTSADAPQRVIIFGNLHTYPEAGHLRGAADSLDFSSPIREDQAMFQMVT